MNAFGFIFVGAYTLAALSLLYMSVKRCKIDQELTVIELLSMIGAFIPIVNLIIFMMRDKSLLEEFAGNFLEAFDEFIHGSIFTWRK